MRLHKWNRPRLDNSGRERWSQVRILNTLKSVAPQGLRFNELLQKIEKEAEKAEIPVMSTRTLSKHLESLGDEGCIVKNGEAYYITKRGFQELDYLTEARRYETLLRDSSTILIGQELREEEKSLKSYTILLKTEKTGKSLEKETEEQLAKITQNYLMQVESLMSREKANEVKIQATILDKKTRKNPVSVWTHTQEEKEEGTTEKRELG